MAHLLVESGVGGGVGLGLVGLVPAAAVGTSGEHRSGVGRFVVVSGPHGAVGRPGTGTGRCQRPSHRAGGERTWPPQLPRGRHRGRPHPLDDPRTPTGRPEPPGPLGVGPGSGRRLDGTETSTNGADDSQGHPDALSDVGSVTARNRWGSLANSVRSRPSDLALDGTCGCGHRRVHRCGSDDQLLAATRVTNSEHSTRSQPAPRFLSAASSLPQPPRNRTTRSPGPPPQHYSVTCQHLGGAPAPESPGRRSRASAGVRGDLTHGQDVAVRLLGGGARVDGCQRPSLMAAGEAGS